MDDIYRQQEQNENPMRPPSDPRYQQQAYDASQQRQYHQAGSSSSDRQRMMHTSGRVLGSSGGPAAYGGYYQEAPASAYTAGTHGAMAYPPPPADYTQDARHAQSFANTYSAPNAQVIYSVPQAGGQGAIYDTPQSFASRQHGGMQMMAPDVASSAYYPSDTSAAGAVAIHRQQPAQSGTPSTLYQQQGPSDKRASLVASYGPGMAPLPAASGHGAQQTVGANTGRTSSTATAAGSQDYAETNESFTAYQRTLKDVFKNIKSGSLAPASESLLEISDWLLTRVESLGKNRIQEQLEVGTTGRWHETYSLLTLGLTTDDEDLYEGRVKLWKNFNNAWLGILEKQKEMMWSGNSSHRSQSLISYADLQKMARELVRLCDGIERFGLVDYDYGVWEERIMASKELSRL